MPELPEVETIRIGLGKLLPGKKIRTVWHDWPKAFPNQPSTVKNFLIGSTVTSIQRRGKTLIINLDSSYSLLVHLKMTGQLVYRPQEGKGFGAGHPSDSLIGALPDKSTHVTLGFDKAK